MNWIDFPLKLQKNMVLIIGRSQDDVQFTGLDLINCTLAVFGNVRLLRLAFIEIFNKFSLFVSYLLNDRSFDPLALITSSSEVYLNTRR